MNAHRIALATAALTLGAALVPAALSAQDLHPSRRPSPMGLARVTLGDAYVKVHYSRPYQRDRDNIFGTKESGALVPYGEVWRTGANEATEITTTKDLMFGDKKLAAGTYSVFTTPGAEEWSIHFNSRLGLAGTGIFEDGKFTPVDLAPTEALMVKAKAATLEEKDEVDQFTISFAKTDKGADLVLRWIRTEVKFPFSVGM